MLPDMTRKVTTGRWKTVRAPLVIQLATPCPVCKQLRLRYVMTSKGEMYECTNCGWWGKLLRAGYSHHPKQSRWTVEATNLMRDFLAGKLDSSDLVDR